MSCAPTQPVGNRVRFPPPPSTRGGGDFLTPTRPGGAVANSPFRTALRNSAHFEAESNVNPFTPRLERGVSPGGSRTLSRRNTTMGSTSTLSRGSRAGLHQSSLAGASGLGGGVDRTHTPLTSSANDSDYDFPRGVGGWPTNTLVSESDRGRNGLGNPVPGDFSAPSPFARPKSPAPRPASPRQMTKKLPSFLLGSMQLSKSPGRSSAFQADTGIASTTSTQMSMFGFGAGTTAAQVQPVTPPAITQRASRRLSGFGSNDMLSTAYGSAAGAKAATQRPGLASSLDDAPPIMTLDDMDMDHTDVFSAGNSRDAQAPTVDMDAFAAQLSSPRDFTGAFEQSNERDDGSSAEDEQDYSDVKIRSIVVYGLLPETESGVLNYFRGFGDILAFAVVPSGSNSLALLYSEPWQAQRAIAQGGSGGRILMGDRMVVSIDWATEDCVALLFNQVFPGRNLPRSAAPPSNKSATLAQSIYAQSPRAKLQRPATAPSQSPGRGSRVDRVRGMGGGVGGSPFKQQQPGRVDSRDSATATAGGTRTGSSVVLAPPTAPKARNGIIQTAIDILFGW
ncbi:hypothetical protein GQ54DRAFT_296943 [Martensiomyces pterosporus]|nr:hypothetical protein GQ54DRAFT_296943 [Martensiomyces pterosporus]